MVLLQWHQVSMVQCMLRCHAHSNTGKRSELRATLHMDTTDLRTIALRPCYIPYCGATPCSKQRMEDVIHVMHIMDVMLVVCG